MSEGVVIILLYACILILSLANAVLGYRVTRLFKRLNALENSKLEDFLQDRNL